MVKRVFLNLLILACSGWLPLIAQTSTSRTNHPVSKDKVEWQRLLLLLSSTYFHVVKEAQVDLDSSLIYASQSLRLSRLPVVAEGIDDAELLADAQWVDERNPQKGIHQLTQVVGKRRLALLTLLGSYYAFEPDSYHHHRDSVEYFLSAVVRESKGSDGGTLRGQALCLLGKMYVQGRDFARGDSVFNLAIHESLKAKDKLTEARAFSYRGLFTAFSPASTASRIKDLQKASDLYSELNNKEGQINAMTNIGYLHVTTFAMNTAEEFFNKALMLEEAIHYPYQHYNTDAVAMITTIKGKFGEPLRYTLQTIKSAENFHDSIGLAYFYSRLSALYSFEGGKEAESRKWHDKAMTLFIQTRDASLYKTIMNNVTEREPRQTLEQIVSISKRVPPRNLNDWMNYHIALTLCYIQLEELDLADRQLRLADDMQKQAEKYIGPYRRSTITINKATIAYGRGDYHKAKQYCEAYLKDPSRGGQSFFSELWATKILINIDSIFNDKASALVRYRTYTQLLDSNYKVSKIRQAEELQVIYQTEERETQIALLNEQSKVEKATAAQANLTRNVTIGGIILVAIIAGLLYWQNQQKQRNNNVITHKNELLQHFLTEKEWLLKEIHHRVKNNLQIVMSLLNSQSAYINNDAALTAIHDSQHRVHAMSLIHQKLYNSDNVATIDMRSYVMDLVSYLRDAFSIGQRIRFETDIDVLELDVSQAVPLGLILNEAITNAIKYAFPNDVSGLIRISLKNTGANHYLLGIADNGVGMPPHICDKKPGSLGMRLMAGLSQDLEGKFAIQSKGGTTVEVSFIHELNVKRPQPVSPAMAVSY